METMTKLEREQALRLVNLDDELDRLFNRNNELASENEMLRTEREKLRKEMQQHSDMIVQQLRDELAKCKEDLRLSKLAASSEADAHDEACKTIQQLQDELTKYKNELDSVNQSLHQEQSHHAAAIYGIEHSSYCRDSDCLRCQNEEYSRANADLKQRAERTDGSIYRIAYKIAPHTNDMTLDDSDYNIVTETDVIQMIEQVTDKLSKVTKERDEALAKVKQLEQPRMVMRDGGQWWEVFKIKPGEKGDDTWEFCSVTDNPGKFLPCYPTHCLWLPMYLYRRPLTTDELRGWLPQQPDAKPEYAWRDATPDDAGKGYDLIVTDFPERKGEIRTDRKLVSVNRNDERPFVTKNPLDSSDVRKWRYCRVYAPVEKQQPSEVLFDGVRPIAYSEMQRLKEDKYGFVIAPSGTTSDCDKYTPYHVTIRKAASDG